MMGWQKAKKTEECEGTSGRGGGGGDVDEKGMGKID
jgi:hypothetical protein